MPNKTVSVDSHHFVKNGDKLIKINGSINVLFPLTFKGKVNLQTGDRNDRPMIVLPFEVKASTVEKISGRNVIKTDKCEIKLPENGFVVFFYGSGVRHLKIKNNKLVTDTEVPLAAMYSQKGIKRFYDHTPKLVDRTYMKLFYDGLEVFELQDSRVRAPEMGKAFKSMRYYINLRNQDALNCVIRMRKGSAPQEFFPKNVSLSAVTEDLGKKNINLNGLLKGSSFYQKAVAYNRAEKAKDLLASQPSTNNGNHSNSYGMDNELKFYGATASTGKKAAEAERKRVAAEKAAEAERKRVAAEKAAEAERKRVAAEKAAEAERKRVAAEKAAAEKSKSLKDMFGKDSNNSSQVLMNGVALSYIVPSNSELKFKDAAKKHLSEINDQDTYTVFVENLGNEIASDGKMLSLKGSELKELNFSSGRHSSASVVSILDGQNTKTFVFYANRKINQPRQMRLKTDVWFANGKIVPVSNFNPNGFQVRDICKYDCASLESIGNAGIKHRRFRYTEDTNIITNGRGASLFQQRSKAGKISNAVFFSGVNPSKKFLQSEKAAFVGYADSFSVPHNSKLKLQDVLSDKLLNNISDTKEYTIYHENLGDNKMSSSKGRVVDGKSLKNMEFTSGDHSKINIMAIQGHGLNKTFAFYANKSIHKSRKAYMITPVWFVSKKTVSINELKRDVATVRDIVKEDGLTLKSPSGKNLQFRKIHNSKDSTLSFSKSGANVLQMRDQNGRVTNGVIFSCLGK